MTASHRQTHEPEPGCRSASRTRLENTDTATIVTLTSNQVSSLHLVPPPSSISDTPAMAVAENTAGAASLPYHEPNIAQILVMASFLVVLNGVNSIIDRLVYCGLIGQVFIGIAWGTPGAQWLASTLSSSTAAFEHVVVQLGYLGLILLVYEGGVSTSIAALKANLLLSIIVATTGIAAPMGLSFILGPLVGATPLQCFAAGAALCSTSLGTTFTVLSTSGLSSTRLGSVLSTAAMMDDVVGLVMVQIVSSLGSAEGGSAGSSVSSIEPVTVLWPVLVSVAFAVVIPLTNRFLLRPAMRYLDDKEDEISMQHGQQGGQNHKKMRAVFGIFATREGALVIHTALLLGLVAGAAYAGASVLLAAYLAGIMVCWWDAERETRWLAKRASAAPANSAGPRKSEHTGVAIYEHYFEAAVSRILKPFFFVSALLFPACLSCTKQVQVGQLRTSLAFLANYHLRHPLASPFPSRRCSPATSCGGASFIPSSCSSVNSFAAFGSSACLVAAPAARAKTSHPSSHASRHLSRHG